MGNGIRNTMTSRLIWVCILGAAAIFALSGCAEFQQQKYQDKIKLLEEAGFKRIPANTPMKLEKLKELDQNRLTMMESEEGSYYVYADAEKCKCVYAGTYKNFERYQELSRSLQKEEWERRASRTKEDSIQDWQLWSPHSREY